MKKRRAFGFGKLQFLLPGARQHQQASPSPAFGTERTLFLA
jgi:hypothetical protein